MRRSGFTLVELLVVIAIIGVLVAILLPAVQAAREAARKTHCRNNLKQLGLALHNYHDTVGCLPPGYLYRPDPAGNGAGFGWGAMILPQLEQSPLYDTFAFHLPIWNNANVQPRMRHLKAFLCPSDPHSHNSLIEMGSLPEKYAMGCYVACFGPPDLDETQEQRLGTFSRNSATRLAEVTDGLSHTLFVGERTNGPFKAAASHGVHTVFETTWSAAVRDADDPTDDHGHMVLFQTGHPPNAPQSDDRDISGPHSGIAHFLFGDGSVHAIGETIDFGIYTAIGTKAGGEATGEY